MRRDLPDVAEVGADSRFVPRTFVLASQVSRLLNLSVPDFIQFLYALPTAFRMLRRLSMEMLGTRTASAS